MCVQGLVNASTNKQAYKRLLTNRLHGKAAELCLATSRNHCVTTTKYIKYINGEINSIHGMR